MENTTPPTKNQLLTLNRLTNVIANFPINSFTADFFSTSSSSATALQLKGVQFNLQSGFFIISGLLTVQITGTLQPGTYVIDTNVYDDFPRIYAPGIVVNAANMNNTPPIVGTAIFAQGRNYPRIHFTTKESLTGYLSFQFGSVHIL